MVRPAVPTGKTASQFRLDALQGMLKSSFVTVCNICGNAQKKRRNPLISGAFQDYEFSALIRLTAQECRDVHALLLFWFHDRIGIHGAVHLRFAAFGIGFFAIAGHAMDQ